MTLNKVGITLGDPGGIGPEVVLKVLSSKELTSKAHFIIFGSSNVIEEEQKILGTNLDFKILSKEENVLSSGISLYEIKTGIKQFTKGISNQENGKASFLFFDQAVKKAREGIIDAVVTAPISKESWSMAGVKWAGHTEYLTQFFPDAIMAFWSDILKVVLFTHHMPLKQALKKVTKEKLIEFFLNLHQYVEKAFPHRFSFLTAGLNPHAGEKGLLGKEEIEHIIPAVRYARNKGMRISDPLPPDVVFRNALNKPDTIVIAHFHDQGLIPFKLLCFHKGVNLTLSLPFIRTSPDHGTAFDIAGKGKANPESMKEAVKLACLFSLPGS
ncbi:MAG: 4-hydroxythreonine-4-phosphate dehydrogenase PdxA [Candidatus Aminicenantaceae bacterium]